MTKELLQQALVNVHDAILRGNSDGELLVMIDDALRDAKAQQEQPASVDAYVGAREDAAIWKKRALEAEELNRKFIAEVNGPTYLGEPAQREQPAQEPVMYQYRWINPGGNKDVLESDFYWNTVEVRHPADKIESRIEELESSRYNGKPCYEVRGLFAAPPTQPTLSDELIESLGKHLFCGPCPSAWHMACRSIEAHCRGGRA